MKNKKGFTLIELLAVIVVLAIIALIATPIVMNTIKNAKKGAAERGAENYIKQVETSIATSKLDNKDVADGTYTIDQDGNITGTGLPDDKLTIEMNGEKPKSGAVVIKNGQVTTDSTMIIGDYTVSYNPTSKKYEATEKTTNPEVSICEYKGTDTSKKYEYGAEYECDPGDGVKRTFYVLEDGDTTSLTKTDGSIHYALDKVGTANAGEVSLIMNQSIGTSPYISNTDWIEAGGCEYGTEGCENYVQNTSYGPITANKYLKSETTDKGWKTEVYLPTYDQICQIKGECSGNDIEVSEFPWLYESLDKAYWMSTGFKTGSNTDNWSLVPDVKTLVRGWSSVVESFNILPVITISKSQIG